VLGANDGVVSTSCIILGVAAARASSSAILTAGVAGMAAGAMSMASGEYVSVSSQKDAEIANAARRRVQNPEAGGDDAAAQPLQAAAASAVSFTAGGMLPLVTAASLPGSTRIVGIVISTLAALALTGGFGAWAGHAPPLRAVARVVVWGTLAMAVTTVIGATIGSSL
jgi:vacuolar iron transporter family protein